MYNYKYISLATLPFILYVSALFAYLMNWISGFQFVLANLIATLIVLVSLLVFRNVKKWDKVFLGVGVVMLALLLFEYSLINYEKVTYEVVAEHDPVLVNPDSGIYVLVVYSELGTYIEDATEMKEVMQQGIQGEILTMQKINNRMRYTSKNQELLSYIKSANEPFQQMADNVNAYLQVESPFVDTFLQRDDVDGDSAGLALALNGLFEQGLFENEQRISVTGAIDAKGNVKEIGSADAKTLIAAKNGFSYILMPSENVAEAEKAKLMNALAIDIIGVDHIDEAVREITRINNTR